jgi:uncharacterized protein YjbI with pentapeptide repeats
MRKRISRKSLAGSNRARRASETAKPKADDRPNARDLLATVNSASEGAAATWIAFLGTMAYLAVTLGGVSHVDLLLNNDTTLPFVNVKVPLATFFVAAPLAFVLVHFSLLLQHVMLSRKLAAFEARLAKEEPSVDRHTQHIRDELHSYTFTQVASGKPRGAVVDMAQRLVVSLSLVVFPLLLLTFFQIGFLPYHSEPITWWHRGMLLADAVVVWLLARHLARLDPVSKVRLTDWWHATSRFKSTVIAGWHRALSRTWSTILAPTSFGAWLAHRPIVWAHYGGESVIRAIAPTRLTIAALILFSACVATLPDDPLDTATAWVARTWLPGLSEPLPFCRERCPEIPSGTRHAFYPTAYLFEQGADVTLGKSDNLLGWSRNLIVTDKNLAASDDHKKEKRISLRGRDLRYAVLDRSRLKRADLYGAKLAGARLIGADLYAASFRMAQLPGAKLTDAELQGAEFSWAELQGAELSDANLQGADLTAAQLQGAGLAGARLQGSDFTGAQMQGAGLTGAKMQGANLFWADLRVADLSRAELQGADLSRSKLQGAVLTQALVFGSTLGGAGEKEMRKEGWDLATFTQVGMSAPDDKGRKALAKQIGEIEKLLEQMAEESVADRRRAEDAAKRVAGRLRPLLQSEGDNKWSNLMDWCELARQPPPDPAKLAAYLGAVACNDTTDKAYTAQGLVRRILELKRPGAFLDAFKGCPAFGRIPEDLKWWLERAAQQERESPAKPADANVTEPPPEPPEACTKLTGARSKAEPAKR